MMENLIEIDFSHQNDITFFRDLYFYFDSPPKLEKLDISDIFAPSNYPLRITIHNSTHLKYINVQSNSIAEFQQFTYRQSDPRFPLEADLSRNNMFYFDGFSESINHGLIVEGLFLSENRLGKQLDAEGEDVFKCFKDLIKLNLTLNEIKKLPQSVFANLHKLEYLILRKNSFAFDD